MDAYTERSLFLAVDAIKSRTLTLPQAFYRRCAHFAGQAATVIHHGIELKMTGFAMGIGKIPQGASASCNSLRQYLLNGAMQQGCARFADAGCLRRGADTGQKQHLGRVNITHTHHRLAASSTCLMAVCLSLSA